MSNTTVTLFVNPFTTISESSTFATQNSTFPTSDTSLPVWTGFVGCLVASLFFGSNFVPVKQFSAGDGFFFQFCFCVATWIIGLITDLIVANKRFYPLVLVGGILWTTGNLATVFCIKTCGLSVGLLIWGTTSLIVGWAGGRFGVLGLKAQVPTSTPKLAMNYISVVFAALSAVFFLFINSENTPRRSPSFSIKEDDKTADKLSEGNNMVMTVVEYPRDEDFPFLNRLSRLQQKILGYILAALAGVFYGIMFIPDSYIRDHPEDFQRNGENPASNGLYYVNSQYSGILLSSTFYFIVYSGLKRNKPSINPSICLPAMVSGTMWAIANIGFIVAISALKQAVAYPIVSVLPGIVTSLWSLFFFREISGRRNLIFLGSGMALRCLAAVLSGLSA
ncbi:unnamed protein product [Didymodactylos carnosus]|uniref:Transmembrane protein 144 n=1 Tax=Didymodactylos carnosus TaxID=1234261 RepID=A0A813YLH2_9BILA|nr:unnamed protein product [Didymodactylos carnosus]CAF1543493.1 unnamed protein product [Didymodactylos carnosus]CAF3671141.1 unnamed protein product [Didymodactylos carnosus]CAF4332264.1 unnamed protein product [Didymodactylos carnosus]